MDGEKIAEDMRKQIKANKRKLHAELSCVKRGTSYMLKKATHKQFHDAEIKISNLEIKLTECSLRPEQQHPKNVNKKGEAKQQIVMSKCMCPQNAGL